jgi:hypothetical protein
MKRKFRQILEKALDVFRKTTNLEAEFQGYEYQDRGYPDAIMKITQNNVEYYFDIEVKLRLTKERIGLIAQQFMKYEEKGLLVTRYVTPQNADLLKDMDIPFLDTAGNAYINCPPLYVFIKGNRLKEPPRTELIQRAFRPAGLRVLFVLLCNPGTEKEPLREIARTANVALGTVDRVIKELEKMGYLIDMGRRGRRLVKKDDLLKRWITNYAEQLRPRQIIARFKAPEHFWWMDIDIQDFGALWGGETAAAILTKYLKPEVVTIYTLNPIGKLVLKNKLKKHPNGNVEILDIFWNFENDKTNKGLVHPILIYADLMATGDNRNIEVAGKIYDTAIVKYIKED